MTVGQIYFPKGDSIMKKFFHKVFPIISAIIGGVLFRKMYDNGFVVNNVSDIFLMILTVIFIGIAAYYIMSIVRGE